MSNLYVKVLALVLSVIKALWQAFTTIVWGLASFFLLAGLLVYFKQDPSAIQSILLLVPIFTKNWLLFFAAIFIYEVLYLYKDLIPKDKVVIRTEREPMIVVKERYSKPEDIEGKERKGMSVASKNITDVIEAKLETPLMTDESEENKKEKKRAYMREYIKKYKKRMQPNPEVAEAPLTDVIESENDELPKQIEDAKIEPIKLPEDEKKEKKRAYMREYMREYKKKKKAQQQDVEVKVENGS
jgi:hypothetical protein